MNFGIGEDQKGWLEGYERLLVQHRIAKSPEAAKIQAVLWWVLDFGSLQQLRDVLAAGADPNIVFPRGDTPLGYALHRFRGPDRMEAIQALLAAGADPTVRSAKVAPLVAARGYPEISRVLLAAVVKKGKPSVEDLSTALLFAAAGKDSTLASELLAAGASPNYLGTDINPLIVGGNASALMLASVENSSTIVRLLLSAGADVNLKDKEGHTALDYAVTEGEKCRRVISILEQAGGQSGRPFPRRRDDGPEKEFRRAARKRSYKQLVARIQQSTGIKPTSLTGPDDDIPGGFGFVFDDDPPKTLVEQGVGQFIAAGERARKFVEQHQAEMLKQGAYLFYTRDLAEQNGPAVAVVPTTDIYQVLAAVETEGANEGVSCEDLQAWIRDLEKVQPFVIVGLGTDFVEGKFTSPIRDAPSVVRRINQICKPEDSSPEAEEKQIANLRQTQRFFLWWD